MRRKVHLPPSPSMIPSNLEPQWLRWFDVLFGRVGEGPLQVQGYSVGSLPNPDGWGSVLETDPFTSLIFVYDSSNGPVLAYSNGSNWLSIQDGSVIS